MLETPNPVTSVNGMTGDVEIDVGGGAPPGGTTGQVLAKNSNTDNDTEWIDVLDTGAYIPQFEDTGTYIYFGEAVTGSATSSAVWRIKRLTIATGVILFADGNANFDNVWNSRAGLSYS